MKLNKKQKEAIDQVIESVQGVHEVYKVEGEDGYYPDDKDAVLFAAEKLVFELGKIDKTLW